MQTGLWMQQQRAHRIGERRAAWLPRDTHGVPSRAQALGQLGRLGRLASAFAALERDESPRHALVLLLAGAGLAMSPATDRALHDTMRLLSHLDPSCPGYSRVAGLQKRRECSTFVSYDRCQESPEALDAHACPALQWQRYDSIQDAGPERPPERPP